MRHLFTEAWVATHQARMARDSGQAPAEPLACAPLQSLSHMAHAEDVQAGPWITLTLPYPPSGNHLYTVARGRKILSTAGRNYERAVAGAFFVQRPKPWTPLIGSCQVILGLFPPNRRTYDIDNPIKQVVDALTKAGLWGDDGQMDDCRALRGSVSTTPYVLAMIRSVSPQHSREVLGEFLS